MKTPKIINLVILPFLLCGIPLGSAFAAPINLGGMGIVNQWTDFENQTREMPANVWGTSDATSEDRIGLHVLFNDGLEGSVTYSGVSGLWNTANFPGMAADTATGFFDSASGLHFLFNNTSNLPMAWRSFVMPFSNNFDLDYNSQNGSHFRANTTGWISAEFTTYSSAVSAVPEPSTYALMLGGLGMVGFMSYRRRKASLKVT